MLQLYAAKSLERFHALNVLWKYIRFKLVFLRHKIIEYSDASVVNI